MTSTEVAEHRAIVFKMNRKQAQSVSRYIKAHDGAGEFVFAVDVDALELVVMARGAHEEDNLIFEGEEDIFDIQDEEIDEDGE